MARFTSLGFTFSNATSFGAQTGSRQLIDIKASGIADVAAVMRTFPEKMSMKIARKTMRQSLDPLFSEVQSLTPVGKTGKMKQSLKKRVNLRKSTGWMTGAVVADGNIAPHFHLVDLGWNLTGHKPEKKFIRKVQGRRIMKGALERQANSIVEKFASDLKELAAEAQQKVGKG